MEDNKKENDSNPFIFDNYIITAKNIGWDGDVVTLEVTLHIENANQETKDLYFSKEMQSMLLISKGPSVQVDDMLATIFPSRFLKQDSKIWQIIRHPGILDRPSISVGIYDNNYFLLSTFDRVVSFYNTSIIIPISAEEATNLAIELLKIVYYRDEFGYANNATAGRGYVIIKGSNDIIGHGKVPLLKTLSIASPTTIVKDGHFLTTIWFWGKHNCELHEFTMTSFVELGIMAYNDEHIGDYGTCHPLYYV